MKKGDVDRKIDEAVDSVLWRLAGDVEARNVVRRMDMTPAERRDTPPWETEDVPRDQQIVSMEDALAEIIKVVRSLKECSESQAASLAAEVLASRTPI